MTPYMSLSSISFSINQVTFLPRLTHCNVFLSLLQRDKNFFLAHFSTLLCLSVLQPPWPLINSLNTSVASSTRVCSPFPWNAFPSDPHRAASFFSSSSNTKYHVLRLPVCLFIIVSTPLFIALTLYIFLHNAYYYLPLFYLFIYFI